MATTTNFGWSTPDNSGLVKDGASDIRTLGSAIDTTMGELKGGTTGQVLSKTSGTDMDFTWATPSGGGGMTLLSTVNLTGTEVTISAINQSYANLYLYIYGLNIDSDSSMRIAPNGSTSITSGIYSSTTTSPSVNTDSGLWPYTADFSVWAGDATNAVAVTISNYSNTSGYKPFQVNGYVRSAQDGHPQKPINSSGAIKTNSAITSLVFYAYGANFNGGTIKVYGA